MSVFKQKFNIYLFKDIPVILADYWGNFPWFMVDICYLDWKHNLIYLATACPAPPVSLGRDSRSTHHRRSTPGRSSNFHSIWRTILKREMTFLKIFIWILCLEAEMINRNYEVLKARVLALQRPHSNLWTDRGKFIFCF